MLIAKSLVITSALVLFAGIVRLSVERECLDHLIVLGEGQLRRILREYFDYYNEVRPHQSLEKNSPLRREIEQPTKGRVISIPQVGGLHHRYRRAA